MRKFVVALPRLPSAFMASVVSCAAAVKDEG